MSTLRLHNNEITNLGNTGCLFWTRVCVASVILKWFTKCTSVLLMFTDFINPPSDTSRRCLCIQCGNRYLQVSDCTSIGLRDWCDDQKTAGGADCWCFAPEFSHSCSCRFKYFWFVFFLFIHTLSRTSSRTSWAKSNSDRFSPPRIFSLLRNQSRTFHFCRVALSESANVLYGIKYSFPEKKKGDSRHFWYILICEAMKVSSLCVWRQSAVRVRESRTEFANTLLDLGGSGYRGLFDMWHR